MEIIQIVHGVVGDNIEMLIEGHGRFNRSTAMKIGKELEKYPNNGCIEYICRASNSEVADIIISNAVVRI